MKNTNHRQRDCVFDEDACLIRPRDVADGWRDGLVLPGSPWQSRSAIRPSGADDPAVCDKPGDCCPDQGVDLVSSRKGEYKDDVTQTNLRRWSGGEGVLCIDKTLEKARVLRTQRRVDPATGRALTELVLGTAIVNARYIYVVDDDFGPRFIKLCSSFPYNIKLCLNGHEFVKRQLDKRRVAFEALDNGILSCADPVTIQAVADNICASWIEALFRI